MPPNPLERLKRFYSVFNGKDNVLIVINADPDSIGAAICVKRLLWRKVVSVSICSINKVKRPDNVAMVELLCEKLLEPDDVDKNMYNRFVLLDSQPDHNPIFNRFKFDVIIDHHPLSDFSASYTDIRPQYGATSAMMTEYLRAAKIRPSKKVATALFLGIKTDTCDFQRKAFSEDLKAFQFLSKYISMDMIQKIEYSEIDQGFLKYFQIAFNSRVMRRGKIFIHLGKVETPDVCVLVADFFLKIKDINWTFVSGMFENRLVIIIRNSGLRFNAGGLASRAFSCYGPSGGHRTMARAELPVPDLPITQDINDDTRTLNWIIGRVEGGSCRRKK